MNVYKDNAPAVAAARARDTTKRTTSAFCHTSDFAQEGKALAVLRYNADARSLEDTQGAFVRYAKLRPL